MKNVFRNNQKRSVQTWNLSLYNPRHGRCNILLFGISGAGKSSIINTLKSLENEVVDQVADVRYSNMAQCTVKFNTFRFNEKVAVMDTWGWSGDTESEKPNYTESSFKSILGGLMKNDHHINDELNMYGTPENSQIIDAVVFVVGSDIRDNKKILIHMKKFYNIARRQQIPVFFAVTKIDLLFENNENNEKKNLLIEPEASYAGTLIHQSSIWRDIQSFIKKNIQHPQAVILPIINYTQMDTYCNEVIKYLAAAFVKFITLKIDKHYSEPSPGGGGGGGGGGGPNKPDYFKNEIPMKLNFLNAPDPSVLQISENMELQKKLEADVVYDVFYKVLTLGHCPWRLFSIQGMNTIITGLYDPVRELYFESRGKLTLDLLRQSFGDRFAQQYTFLGTGGRSPLTSYNETLTGYVKITLAGNKNLILVRQRKDSWTDFHCMMLNLVQSCKGRDDLKRVLESKISDLRTFYENKISIITKDLNRLKYQIKNLPSLVISTSSIKPQRIEQEK